MRFLILWPAMLLASPTAPAALAQTADSVRCYDFHGPWFWRVAWSAARGGWARDTTSIVRLTRHPHPPGRMVRPGDRLVVTALPHADSVIDGRRVTSWRAPDSNHVTINWFTGGAAYVIETEVRGDSLVGHLTNHADMITPRRQVVRVLARRVVCPQLPARPATPS